MRLEQIEGALRGPELEADWRQLVASSEVEACSMAAALGGVRQVRESLLRQAALVVADEERPWAVMAQYQALRGLAEGKRRALAQLAASATVCEAAQLALELALASRLLQAIEELLAPVMGLLRQGLPRRPQGVATPDWPSAPWPRHQQPA